MFRSSFGGPLTLPTVMALTAMLMMSGSVTAQDKPVMVQRDIAFAPRSISVKVGQEVIFRNEDPFGHNVFSPSVGGVFDIGLQEPDHETPVTFSTAGVYTVQCRIHPKMRAKIEVTE